MPTVDRTKVIREGKQDGFVTEAQAYHMIRKYSDAYRYLQFDICEVKKVHTSVESGELYGAIQGRLVTTEQGKVLENRWIQPFSLRDFELPSENEYVMVFEYGFSPNEKLYYIRDFSIDRNLNYNIFNFGKSGIPIESEVNRATEVVNKKVKKIVPLPRYKDGDKFIHGRFGQTIQFTSKNNIHPCLRITNNTNKFGEGGLFTPYFDNEGSVIYLEGSLIPLDLKQRVSGVDEFPKELTGDQIVIESDRLIFQSKKEEIFINGYKKVSINSPEILINGQPYVHGNFIKDLVDQLVSIFDKMQKKLLLTPAGPVEVSALLPEISIIKSIQRQIFSSKYKSETNPKGVSPVKKSSEEMKAYLTKSGY